jgi:hypothetical protein
MTLHPSRPSQIAATGFSLTACRQLGLTGNSREGVPISGPPLASDNPLAPLTVSSATTKVRAAS